MNEGELGFLIYGSDYGYIRLTWRSSNKRVSLSFVA